MAFEASGGGYIQLPLSNSEAVATCMRLNAASTNNARTIRPISAPLKRNMPEPHPPTGFPVKRNSATPYSRSDHGEADRDTAGYSGAGSFMPSRSAGIPSYNPFDDPHLYDYYVRKFGSGPYNGGSLHTFGSTDADRLGLRSGDGMRRSLRRRHRGETAYKVAITTGDMKGAGTNAPVYLTLKGLFGTLVRQRLTKKSGSTKKRVPFKFSAGSTNIFTIKSAELGDLQSIVIEHTGIEERDSWFIQSLEIMNSVTKQCWLFACNHWLSLYKEDGKVGRELFGIRSTKTRYEIVTVTGDVQDGGTDSNVSITLHGRTGVTSKLPLKKKNAFDRGKSSTFVVKAPCVGPLSKIRIQHDNTGRNPTWFLERVVVTDLKHPKWKYFFNCGQWFSRLHGDGAIARELKGSREPNGIPKNTQYKLTIYTGNKRGAGTDADVFVQLFGESGHTGEKKLDSFKKAFERGSTDEFTIDSKQLGTLTRMKIWHNNKGFAPGWYLEKVIIDDLVMNRVFEFPCGRWLADDEGDGKICRELICRQRTGAGAGGLGTPFELRVTTGDKRNAGTAARVYCILYGGKKGKENSGKIEMSSGLFQRGRTDIFKIDVAQPLSPVTKLVIGHDNSGEGPGWYLETVVLNCPVTGIEQTFPCYDWLSTDEGDGSIERTLLENMALRKMRSIKLPWLVTVYTSDIGNAGTNAVVHLVVYGEKGKSDDIVLANVKDSFETGKEDVFKIDIDDVGLLTKIRIGHDNSGFAPGWHLDRVKMENLTSNEEFHFQCGRWMSRDEDDGDICRELPARGPGIKKPLPICHYKVQVFTGKRKFAGTDANVFLNIFGDGSDTGDRFLVRSSTNKNKFEKSKMDEFVLEAVKLGKLQKIRIGHDSSNPGSGWYLDRVVITEIENPDNSANFECYRWFAVNEDDGAIVRELKGSTMLDKITYEVSVKTGDIRSGGTDANVFLKIFGSHGDTGNLQLKTTDSSVNKFERGRTDVFKLEAEDIGNLNKIRVSHDGSGAGSGWFLDEVRILVPTHGKQYLFAAHRWLDESEADGKLEVELEPSTVQNVEKTIPYEVTIYTGDKSGAGTDANVFLQIYGIFGAKTEQHNLRSRSDNFERGYVDKFKINALDVGPIQKIRIGHDGEGFGAGWFLDKVQIQRHATKGSRRLKAGSSPPSGRRSRENSIRRRYSRYGEVEGDLDEDELYDDFDDAASMMSFRSGLSSSLRRRRSSAMHRGRRQKAREQQQQDDKINPEELVTGEEEIEDYWFYCNQWFARDEGDQRIVRELLPTTEDGQRLSELEEIDYKVTVVTGDKWGAGTDANVFVNICGDDGDTGELHLMDSETNKVNKFERKSEDVFRIRAIDLGELRKVKIRHDNKGGGAAWFLDYILVNDPRANKEYFFPCQRWLATDKDDGQISRELIPVDKSLMAKLKGGQKTAVKDEIMLEHKAATTTYHVHVVTGDKFGAGTDANVHLILFGELDDTGIVPLKQSKTNRNKFERNQTDEFIVEAVEIGELQKIRIGHDNFGGGAAWYLERIEIDCPTLGMKWYFPCGEWIGEGYGDGSLERDLYPQSMVTEEYIPCIPYEITTFTSDKRGAGTSANVYIQIYGPETATQQKLLCSPKERDGKFKRGKRDKFVVELEDVGDPIEKIRIGHDDSGIGSGWHLERVEIRRLLDDMKGSITYLFPCNKWLARDEEDKAIERELVASKLIEETSRADGQVKRREVDATGGLRKKQYKISVVTGDKFGCGTDANVFLNLFGDRGDTGERKLVNSETHSDKFERNNTDVFTWEAVDLGRIFKAKVRSDESGLNAAWLLDRIEVVDISDGDTYVFHCERWFSSKKDDRRLERSLYVKGYEGDMSSSGTTLRSGSIGSMESMLSARDPFGKSPRTIRRQSTIAEEPEGEGPMIPYTVKILTGKEKEMGTDGPVWIRIMGTKGQHTGRKVLELLQKSKFEPGSRETFSFEALDIEDVRKIEVGNEGITPGSGWFIMEIVVDMPTRGKSYTFQCKTWLARDKLDGKTVRVFSLNKDDSSASRSFKPLVPYELNIYTGDVDEAGTDCQVVFQAFGSQGTTQEYLLDKASDRFERGRRDFFKIELDDVGSLKKLRIGHQNKGDRKDWYLEKVELRNMETLDFYLFKFNDYISKSKGKTKRLMVDIPAIVGGQEQLTRTDYKIFVKTSDIRGAGTDANVYVRLFGENGDSGDLHLKKSETSKNPFATNQLDEFVFKDMLTLGPLARCRVWHDNKGIGAAWHLQHIEVQDLKTRRKWMFECRKWLSLSEDDKQISRDLVCQQAPGEDTEEKSGRTSYEIDVVTSDKMDAGMLHNAWIILEGKHGQSRMFLLRNSREDKILRRGQTDNFKFKSKSIGPLDRIYLGAVEREDRPLGDARGRDAKWHCYEVAVTDEKTGTKYRFPVKRWVPILPEVNQREAEEVEVDEVEEDLSKANVKKIRKLETTKYDVVVFTGDVFGAGTNANVFLTLFGENGDSGRLALKQKGRDLFERKQIDRFTLECLDLGDLDRIKIEHDNSNFRPDWFLDKVEVTHQKSLRTYVFPCEQWLAEKKGDNQLFKILSCA